MKRCSRCGYNMTDEAEYCPICGCATNGSDGGTGNGSEGGSANDQALRNLAKVFMIIACVIGGFALIPLAWCIPMTAVYFDKVKRKEKVGIGFIICTMIFVSRVAGILMICDEANR